MSFDANDQDGMDTKGSIHMVLNTRTEAPSRHDTIYIDFNSFDYDECLLWDVGTVTKAYQVADGDMQTFKQTPTHKRTHDLTLRREGHMIPVNKSTSQSRNRTSATCDSFEWTQYFVLLFLS